MSIEQAIQTVESETASCVILAVEGDGTLHSKVQNPSLCLSLIASASGNDITPNEIISSLGVLEKLEIKERRKTRKVKKNQQDTSQHPSQPTTT